MHIFTEMWLTPSILDQAIEADGQILFRAKRAQDSSKRRGGGLENSKTTAPTVTPDTAKPQVSGLFLSAVVLSHRTRLD